LECIEGRLRVLREIEPASAADREAADFVREDFSPGWERVRAWVEGRAPALGLGLGEEIPRADRCLSPSDFGFHNAILAGGRLRLLDCESAGWDGPARMVCDFFGQVAMPMPAGYFDTVVESVASGLREPGPFRGRVTLLMPVYRVKWCCIVLNHFVRAGGSRRRFADAGDGWEEKKVQQLHKARRVLQSV